MVRAPRLQRATTFLDASRRPIAALALRSIGRWAAAGLVALSACGSPAFAQLPPDFVAPSLVLNAQGHTEQVRSMVVSGDGRYLATGGLDRVVHVWRIDRGKLRLERSFRPPIRGRRGRVNALALSPSEDPKGRRLLAVGGLAATGSGGGILIYRLPGKGGERAGELAFELPADSSLTPEAERVGHVAAVYGLSFSPDGRFLASGSEDRTIRVWDLQASPPRSVGVLAGHAGPVSALAFLDGARIVSGGGAGDGTVRIWDWAAGRLASWVQPHPQDLQAEGGAGVVVNALAVSPDRQSIVVGRENGKIERFDGGDLRNGTLLNPESYQKLSAVEALAVSPDGRTLATSVLKDRPRAAEYPLKDCELILRSMPGGQAVGDARVIPGLVRALAFTPDGRYLAAAGGEAQQVALLDLQARPTDPVARADGPGTVLWEAAFVDDKPTVAYTRTRPVEGRAIEWEGFDLAGRSFVPVAPGAALGRAVRAADGWRFVSRGFNRVALEAQGAEVPVQLSPLDGRWSSYTFIPASARAGHPKLCVAIGCEEGGVLIYSLPDGVRTRLLLGHGGAVQGMAPSPDGRWLLTCSSDMTLSLWSLAGCDSRPALGAEIAPDDQGGGGTVRKVLPRSPAERMGLKAGDHIDGVVRVASSARQEPLEVGRLDATLSAVAPSLEDVARFSVRRQGVAAPIPMSTPRGDAPCLSLFPGKDREWVVWMPEGYYETSIAGDHRLLGWHLNHVDTSNPARFRTLASDFFPMSRYEKQLRKPGVLDAVLRSGDPVAALATANGAPVVQKPPTIRVVGPRRAAPGAEVVAAQPELRLDIEAEASPERRVRSVVVRSDAVRYPAHAIDPGLALAKATETIRLRPDRNVVTIEATDDLGVKAVETLEVRLDAARLAEPWVASPPRLVIRSFGVEAFRERDIDPIPFATRDAEELAAFFNKQAHFPRERIDLKVERDADEKRMLAAFDSLADDARNRRLKAGDTVLIILESHLIKTDSEGAVVLSADSSIQREADRALPGSAIAERLDEVTKSGCLVLLLVDGVHRTTPRADPNAIRDWIRDLVDERGVLVFAASNHGPSERYDEKRLGVFALAVLESQDVAARGRPQADGPITLDDFSEAVQDRVRERSARRQYAGFYAPESLSWQSIRIFDPQPAPVDQLVKK